MLLICIRHHLAALTVRRLASVEFPISAITFFLLVEMEIKSSSGLCLFFLSPLGFRSNIDWERRAD